VLEVSRIKQGIQIGRTVITFEKARKNWCSGMSYIYWL
jgi:hypothetical protein